MPNHKMTRGISARCGTLRTIWSVVSVSFEESCDRPLARPNAKPMLPPIKKPIEARQNETQMLRMSSPESKSFQPASTTSLGAGSTRVGTKPVTLATCQIAMMASGTIHWIRPSRRGRRKLRGNETLSIRLMTATPCAADGSRCRPSHQRGRR
ncbi:hypothetical protein ACVWZZ_002429 [Bradyrhizobium sp. LM6.10]